MLQETKDRGQQLQQENHAGNQGASQVVNIGPECQNNQAFPQEDSTEDSQVILFPIRVCHNCGSASSTSAPSPSMGRRPLNLKRVMADRMLAERRRARKQRMATAKQVARNKQYFKSQIAALRQKMDSSGLSDADCSVLSAVHGAHKVNGAPSDRTSAHVTGSKDVRQILKQKMHAGKHNTKSHTGSKKDNARDKTTIKSNSIPSPSKCESSPKRRKPWELTPEQHKKHWDKKQSHDLNPAGFEVLFQGKQDNVENAAEFEADDMGTLQSNDSITI